MSKQSSKSEVKCSYPKDIMEETKKEYSSFSEVITDTIELRLKTEAELRVSNHLENNNICRIETYICAESSTHNVLAVKYDDKSAWIICPFYGWFDETYPKRSMKLGCMKKKDRCSWFIK